MPRGAIAQAETAPNLEEGRDRTRTLTRDAAAQNAELIDFPETWLPGYPVWLDVCRDVALWAHAPVKAVHARMATNAVAVPGPAADALGTIARDARLTRVVGGVERVDVGPGRGTRY